MSLIFNIAACVLANISVSEKMFRLHRCRMLFLTRNQQCQSNEGIRMSLTDYSLLACNFALSWQPSQVLDINFTCTIWHAITTALNCCSIGQFFIITGYTRWHFWHNKPMVLIASTTTTTVLRPFCWDHPGEPVPEEADTPTIRMGATPLHPD